MAAESFVQRMDLSHSSVGVMAFADQVGELELPCQDGRRIRRALDRLPSIVEDGTYGYSNRAEPFTALLRHAPGGGEPYFVVLLTDGVWSDQAAAVAAAQRCHQVGIEIIALGFGGADRAFLSKIATSEEGALFTDLGRLGECFGRIAQVLSEDGGLAETGGSPAGSRKSIFSGLRG